MRGGRVKGLVSLVGSGPGDPGLLTLAAKKRLEEADIIIYDYLANPAHLLWARAASKKIAVGKGFRHKKISQDKINRLIAASSKKGLRVVRLKGGDPYLFGRGGEEALFLESQGLPFEVVPGVTSATACAAYSGIPLTHRDHNASVTFLTGHRADDKGLDSIPWKNLVSLGGTLVIYMGIYNLERIVKGLLASGANPETPVCVTQWGTLPQQKSCQAPMKSIVGAVKKKLLGAPAIIIIGEVVNLRNKLNWYEKLPLFGQNFLVTRPAEKSSRLADKITEAGGGVYSFSTLKIKATDKPAAMDRVIRDLKSFQWLIFTSTYGVEAFFLRLKNRFQLDARALSGLRVASVGPETAQALKRFGVEPDLQPKRYEARAIAEEFKRQYRRLDGVRMLLLRTNIAPEDLERDLEALGAQVQRITAYRTVPVTKIPSEVKNALLSGRIHWVTFASASSVHHFIRAIGRERFHRLIKQTRLASIGPVTTKAIRGYGIKENCQAKVYTIEGLLEALKNAVS
jgi:uroporphyrinogen III methyltransferase/synthase